jgi:hypothetical protein
MGKKKVAPAKAAAAKSAAAKKKATPGRGKLEQEFRRLEPDATQVTLGRHKVWKWQTVGPAYPFTSLLLLQTNIRAIEVTGRQGYSDDLATRLLDFISSWEGFDVEAKTITVLPWRRSQKSFDQVGVAPPLVAHRFQYQSKVLERVCFWVFPCFSGEFKTGQDAAEFDATLWHFGEVHVVEWDRVPSPHIKFQLLDPWPGGMLRKLNTPRQLPFRTLATYLWSLPIERTRILLQDILGRDLVVIRRSKGLAFSGETLKRPQIIANEEAATARLLSFLRGGNFGQ